jgi:hypothetical protein
MKRNERRIVKHIILKGKPVTKQRSIIKYTRTTLLILKNVKREQRPKMPQQKMESMVEGRALVGQKYNDLTDVIEKELPQLWLAVEFVSEVGIS